MPLDCENPTPNYSPQNPCGNPEQSLPDCFAGKDTNARGKKKGDKFKAIKEAEMAQKASATGAAAKAAELASVSASSSSEDSEPKN